MKNATPLQRFKLRNPTLHLSGASPRRPSLQRPLRKGGTFSNINVFIKREDNNVTGSHKDRGIWPLIEYYRKKRKKCFVISSSGNAAVSAAYYCNKHGLRLDVFVGEKIPREKLERLLNVIASDRRERSNLVVAREKQRLLRRKSPRNDNIVVHQTQFPRRDAFRFAKVTGAQLISTSTDDRCLDGYAKIVKELPKVVDAIFVPASSGALAVGIARGYRVQGTGYRGPKFFVCQTPRVHPLVDDGRERRSAFPTKTSIADAISDVIGERKMQIHNIIQKTKGVGIVVEDRFIKQAMKILKKELKIAKPSPNGSLAFAGLLKLMEQNGGLMGQRIVCLYTGM